MRSLVGPKKKISGNRHCPREGSRGTITYSSLSRILNMAGKRKREIAVASRPSGEKQPSPQPATDAQEIFRKYFEAQFEPIETTGSSKRKADRASSEDDENSEEEDEEDEEMSEVESDWDGVSEESDEEAVVEVVEHKDASLSASDLMDKKAYKAFMVRLGRLLDRIQHELITRYRVPNHRHPQTRKRRSHRQARRTTQRMTPTKQ